MGVAPHLHPGAVVLVLGEAMTDKPATPPTEEELAEWTRDHARESKWCVWCFLPWPCPTARLLAEVRRLREEADRLRMHLRDRHKCSRGHLLRRLPDTYDF